MANTTPKPMTKRDRHPKRPEPAPSSGPLRLTAHTEAHIRAMIEGQGFNNPSLRVCLSEIDALRLELAEVREELAEHDRIAKEWSL